MSLYILLISCQVLIFLGCTILVKYLEVEKHRNSRIFCFYLQLEVSAVHERVIRTLELLHITLSLKICCDVLIDQRILSFCLLSKCFVIQQNQRETSRLFIFLLPELFFPTFQFVESGKNILRIFQKSVSMSEIKTYLYQLG